MLKHCHGLVRLKPNADTRLASKVKQATRNETGKVGISLTDRQVNELTALVQNRHDPDNRMWVFVISKEGN